MRKISMVMMSVLVGLTVAGCAKKPTSMAANDAAGANGAGDNVCFYGSNLSPEAERALMAKDTYYFGYDQYSLNDEDTLSLYAHAKKLASSGGHVRIEGHTDERGSREYNIALGDRRAKSIANTLMTKGVGQNQISVVSYGKEKPATGGHDESAWSLNRRGAVVYE